jgi:hypothetical protein
MHVDGLLDLASYAALVTLQRRGVVYDVGVLPTRDWPSRPHFDAEHSRRDMAVISEALNCNAVRITGLDLERLSVAAQQALEQGLEVWLSPMMHDATADALLTYLTQAAELAERLRAHGTVVLIVGWELTLFMRGLVPGDTLQERIKTFKRPWRLIADMIAHGSFNSRLNAFLQRAVQTARQHFSGPITYSSGTWEQVDWGGFDYVGVDCYRDARNRRRFPTLIGAYRRHGKPIVATEFGCCTYVGARDKGGMAWSIVDRRATPPRLKGIYRRSEAEQAAELNEVLDILDHEGIEGAFVFTFATWINPHHAEPAHDLDMAAYGIVACAADGSWRPKRAFDVVARRYQA